MINRKAMQHPTSARCLTNVNAIWAHWAMLASNYYWRMEIINMIKKSNNPSLHHLLGLQLTRGWNVSG